MKNSMMLINFLLATSRSYPKAFVMAPVGSTLRALCNSGQQVVQNTGLTFPGPEYHYKVADQLQGRVTDQRKPQNTIMIFLRFLEL